MTQRPGPGLLLAGLGCVLALSACSSDSEPPGRDPAAGGDVDRVPGQVVDADSLAISPDGDRIAAGCGDRLCIWDTTDGTLAATYDGGNVVAWSPDGDLLATSDFSDDSTRATVVLLDPADGSEIRTLDGHDAPAADDAVGVGITDLAFSPDGTHLASAGHDGVVRVWSLGDDAGDDPAVLRTASADPDAVAFGPDGRQLAVAGPDAPTEVWTVDGDRVGTLGNEPQGDVAWSPDGGSIATATRAPGAHAAVHLWDATTLKAAGDDDPVAAYRLAWSPDSADLAMTVKDDETVLVCTVGADDTMRLTGHDDQPRGVVWSPDGEVLYSASSSEGVLAWDVANGDLARRFDLPEDDG